VGGRSTHFLLDPKKFATFKAAYGRKGQLLPELLRLFGLQPKDQYTFYRHLMVDSTTASPVWL
jgi:hypothetical protein